MTKSVRIWKLACFFSLIVGAIALSSTLGRPADGDDSHYFYTIGLTSWSEILSKLFLFPKEKIFIYNRFRPFCFDFWLKFLWTLGLTPEFYKVINWILNWSGCVLFSFGMFRFLSLGFAMAPEAPWAMACLLWWSPPLFLTTSGTFYPAWVEVTLGGALILASKPNDWGKTKRGLRVGLAALLTFFACQSHEKAWILLVFFAGWLGILESLKKIKADGPKFWWPISVLAFYLIFFRSFSTTTYKDAVEHGPGLVFTSEKLLMNCSYYFMVLFNAIFKPIPEWIGAKKWALDFTELQSPVPFLLTIAGLNYGAYLKLRERKSKKSRKENEAAWIWAVIGLLLGIIVFTAPFWFSYFRLIHYMITPAAFMSIAFVAWMARGKDFKHVPVVLLLIGNLLTSVHIVQHWNWIEFNAKNNKSFTDAVLKLPELKDCTSERPCCIQFKGRVGGFSEWEMNWNSGAPKWPMFYPDNWPGAPCVKIVSLDK